MINERQTLVQTHTHIFLYDRELEFDGLEPLSVGLPFLVNQDFVNQSSDDLAFFLYVHHRVQLIEGDQHLVDV